MSEKQPNQKPQSPKWWERLLSVASELLFKLLLRRASEKRRLPKNEDS